jgi:hypothetical protein
MSLPRRTLGLVAAGAVSCAGPPPCQPVSPHHAVPTLDQTPGEPPQGPPTWCATFPKKLPSGKDFPKRPECETPTAPAPRCMPRDPACGPQFVADFGVPYCAFDPEHPWPVWHGPHGESGEKCYLPSATRYPLAHQPNADRCTNDGECLARTTRSDPGWNSSFSCVSYLRRLDEELMCALADETPPGTTAAPLTWCGCVEGRCAMFRQ